MARNIIKVFQDYDGALSLEDLEQASDSLVRARICGTEVRVGFNFLQRLLHEVVEARKEDAELFAEIDQIWQEILDEDTDRLPKMSSESFTRVKEHIYEQIGLTESSWKDAEGIYNATRLPSEDLTSSEKTKMSEDTTDMIQIYDPGHPPAEPFDPVEVEVEMRKPLPPPMLGQRRSVMAHSAAHKYWAEDKTVRWHLVAGLVVICLLVWGALIA